MRRLLDFLFPPRPDEKAVRELPSDALIALVRPVIVARTNPETAALLPFSDPRVRAAIHEAKYHGNERALELLAGALAPYLSHIESGDKPALLVPLPLGARRLRERGFNQTEEVARRAAVIPCADGLLSRTRETASQVSLSRKEREENMRGAFLAPRPLSAEFLYIVLDDVITTGATMQATIDALREAGAAHILPIALAH